MKKIWIIGMTVFFPLSLQAMEDEDKNFKSTMNDLSPSHKRGFHRSPTTMDFKKYTLQSPKEAGELIKVERLPPSKKEEVGSIKIERLPSSIKGSKSSKAGVKGKAKNNNSLLKDLLTKEHMKKNLLHIQQESKKYEQGEFLDLDGRDALEESIGESIVRPASPDFSKEKN